MTRTTRIVLLASLLVLAVLAVATVMAQPLVHPCPGEIEQCGRQCAGQDAGPLPWRCPRFTACNCPPPVRWPKSLRGR